MEHKFNVGQTVYFFNSLSKKIESEIVYGVLFIPYLKAGKTAEPDVAGNFAARLAAGDYEIHEQYQTLKNQIMDADVLFASEAECRDYWRAFFTENV